MRIIPPKLPPITKGLLLALVLAFSAHMPTHAQVLETEDTTQPTQETTPTATASATPLASPTETDTVTSLETRTIEGEIIKTNDDGITVDTGDETMEIRLFNNIQITRDGKEVEPSALQTGDQVKAVIDTNSNQAISVEATSAQTAGMQQWLLPAAIGLLLLIAVVYWLMKRANRQRIKTTNTKM